MNEIVRQYHDSKTGVTFAVPFTVDGYANATEMAKPYGKAPKDWLKTDRAQEYIDAVQESSEGTKIPSLNLVTVERGGADGGATWLHRDLVVEFARWLSPRFAVWCDRQIVEILRLNRATAAGLAAEIGGKAWTERYISHEEQRGASKRMARTVGNKGRIIQNRRATVVAATGVEPRTFHEKAKSEGLTGDVTKSSLEYMRRKGLPHAPAIALANDVIAKTGNNRAAMRNLTTWTAAFDRIHAGLLDCGVDIAEFCAASEEDVRAALAELESAKQDEAQLTLFDPETEH